MLFVSKKSELAYSKITEVSGLMENRVATNDEKLCFQYEPGTHIQFPTQMFSASLVSITEL
jgi:hypothetical protein